MTYVHELIPGDLVQFFDRSAVFVARTDHPLYPGFQMVIWKLADGTWSHDALSAYQDVGEALPATPEDRQARLRWALHTNTYRIETTHSESTPEQDLRKAVDAITKVAQDLGIEIPPQKGQTP